ncbi:MAG TPA: SDR family NAD(P)-dependent oxidoreductase, partial [Thermomicrobiales bacterium]|nr:SDR family NAD(P)-dependent oxidoreductase [Thermomicrobiales bacterium]
MFRLDGKTALITGAGSGIGRQIALLYGKQGATVAIGDLNDEAGQAVADEITAAGGTAFALHLDVTSLDSANAAVAAVVEKAGKLDILVNNAGIGMVGSLTETDAAGFDRLISVNVNGVFYCSQAA